MSQVTMKQLLEAGVHFGHQSRRWNPKMKPYIYTDRNGIYIIDLKKTLRLLRDATKYVRETVQNGGKVLFVGTKKQAKEIIAEGASAAGMYYINSRWLGGLLTNFQTVRKSVLRLIALERMFEDGSIERYSKKEQSMLNRERQSLDKNLGGIKNMSTLPDVLFVIDPSKESIAVKEANKLGIPVVAVVDTNCDPDPVQFVIPGNDDAIRSIKLMVSQMSDACVEGVAGQGGDIDFSSLESGEFAESTAPAAQAEPHSSVSESSAKGINPATLEPHNVPAVQETLQGEAENK